MSTCEKSIERFRTEPVSFMCLISLKALEEEGGDILEVLPLDQCGILVEQEAINGLEGTFGDTVAAISTKVAIRPFD